MSLIRTLLAGETRESEKTIRYWGASWPVSTTDSGVSVTEESAVKSTAVLAAVRLLSETIASLPLIIYEKLSDGNKRRAPEHPLYPTLHTSPNKRMSSFIWREVLMLHLSSWGNAYSRIYRDNGKRRITRLEPLHPRIVHPELSENGKNRRYRIGRIPSQAEPVDASNVFHVPGLGFDGVQGFSPIRMCREAIGLGLATESFGAKFFGQGSRATGTLEHPGKLSPEGEKNLADWWASEHQGLENANKPLILQEGMKWNQISIPAEDAQFLETRQFQVDEIARIFNLPPHKLRQMKQTSYNNIEQENMDFVITSIRPWLVRWEQEIKRQLLDPWGWENYYVEFLVEGLLRGDIKSRYEAYATGRQWGWLSADDVRGLENMNPLPDGQGKLYLIPMNMIPADQAGQAAAKPARQRIDTLYERMLTNALDYVVRRETNAAKRATQKIEAGGVSPFLDWLEEFYNANPEYIRQAIAPIVDAYLQERLACGMANRTKLVTSEQLSRQFSEENRKKLGRILLEHDGNGAAEAINAQITGWKRTRAGDMARHILHEISGGYEDALPQRTCLPVP